MDSTRTLMSFIFQCIGSLMSAVVLSGIVVFPLAGLAYVAQGISAKRAGPRHRRFQWRTVVTAWVVLTIVILVIFLFGIWYGKPQG